MRTHIGRWHLGEVLGEGGMGTVFLAHHATLAIPAAAKLLSPKLTRDPKFRERFLREARAQAQLRHPGIAQVLDFIEEDEDLCIVVEYLSGGTLEKRLEGGKPLPVGTALNWARQALEALDHANRRGIIHRDIKPSNIMLDEQGHAKVVDFGIALVLDGRRLTTATGSMGTPHYMSPEQIRRPRDVDHRTDVYSMAVVLYEMLAGRPPFDADSEYDIQAAQVNEPPKPLRVINRDVPENVETVVLQALDKNPDGRFQGCGAFARALQEVAHPKVEVIEPPPLPMAEKTAPALNLGRLTAVLAVAAIIAVGVIVSLAGKLNKQTEARSAAETSLATAEGRIKALEERSGVLQELVEAKSWTRSDGDNFDYSFSLFPQGTFPNTLVNTTRLIISGKYRYQAYANGPNVMSLAPRGVVSANEDIYLSVDVRKTRGDDDAYGALIFRSDEHSLYSFRLSGDRFSFWLQKGEWKALKEWENSAAIRANDTNRLAVVTHNNQFSLFINDEKVGQVMDPELNSGQAGIAVGFQDKGSSATYDFDNYELRKRPSGE